MISIDQIVKAKEVIKPFIQETSLLKVDRLSKITGMNIYLKLENMQNSGSFKMRGACFKVANMTEEQRALGIIASSAGNHAQGVACSAKTLGINACIVMPETTPISKVKATKDYGAEVILYGSCYDDAYQKALEIQNLQHQVFVHPFDDEEVIAGQGTVGLEIFQQLAEVDAVIVPIGGGGLISGIALALKALKPEVKIIGVQTENAPSMKISKEQGKIVTIAPKTSIADGIAVGTPGKLTFEIVKQYVDQIITVSEKEIASSILFLLEKQKIVAEGSGAATVAALSAEQLLDLKGKNVVCIISGGNIDINKVESIINHGLINDGRRFNLSIKLEHQVGELQKLLHNISTMGGNVLTIEQNRYARHLGIAEQQVEIVIEAFDEAHMQAIIEHLRSCCYQFR